MPGLRLTFIFMKAIFIERHGPPEVLQEREIPSPEPKDDEIKLRVMASGINFADILQRLNLYGKHPKLPYVPGFEVAGEVVSRGSAVKDIETGDRVAALTRFGGYSEEVCITAQAARPIPATVDFVQAAAIPVNYLTAWFCLFQMGHLQPGEKVLIQGGAGGVGTAAVQLAHHAGAEIFATAGSAEKVKFLDLLGVDHSINYQSGDFYEEIRALTSGRGVDLVLDAVGGDVLRRGYDLLAPLGRLVSYGLSAAAPSKRRSWLKALLAVRRTPSFRPLQLIGRNVGVFGFHLGLLRNKESTVIPAFEAIMERIASGAVRPIVSRTFPLSQAGAVEAHHFIHERRNVGKVLLERETR